MFQTCSKRQQRIRGRSSHPQIHLPESEFMSPFVTFIVHLPLPPLLFSPLTFSFSSCYPTPNPSCFLKNDWSPPLNPPIQRLISDSISVIDGCPLVLYLPPPLSLLTDRFPFHKWYSERNDWKPIQGCTDPESRMVA